MTFLFGIDLLLEDEQKLQRLRSSRVGLVAHPASISSANTHSIDALMNARCNIVRAFGPQHGMRGDKQDNMIESEDYLDQIHQLPVVSLYGEHRYPTDEMLEDLDIVLFDLQDIGCRIYTYITTLFYLTEACSRLGKELWVLDRPNPAGRPIDGLYLETGEESFVGCAPMPTRHGLTVGELGSWFATQQTHELDLSVITMTGYKPGQIPGYGWPGHARPWINPSPKAASINMARIFPGTVLLEGTTLSEGRGTTTPLEVIGAPDLPIDSLLADLSSQAPHWLGSAYLRECFFTPTFHKHVGQLCTGIQIHTDYPAYNHDEFKPYRLIAGLLKSLRRLEPAFDIWRFHPYEYELDRKPIDVINGGPGLRSWVDDPDQDFSEFDAQLSAAENRWKEERQQFLLYP
jgi:uncharacterized protein YbbC (DUF1343 family)